MTSDETATLWRIPSKAEEISAEWLQNILGYDGDHIIDNVNTEEISKTGGNFMVQVIRCKAEGVHGNEPFRKCLVMKIMPYLDWHRKLLDSLLIFDREVAAYKLIFEDMLKLQQQQDKIHLSIPRCIYANIDDDKGIIVLEDVSCSGYRLHDSTLGLDIDHCKLALNELAKLHALGFNVKYSSDTSITEMYPDNAETAWAVEKDLTMVVFKNAISNAKEHFSSIPHRKDLLDLLTDKEDDLIDQFFKAAEPVEPFSTLCHGDFWNENMLFKYDETSGKPVSVKVIDFQVLHYGCPTGDLIYFFVLSTTPELRQEHLIDLLQYYYTSLFKYLEELKVTDLNRDSFSFDELLRLYYKKTGIAGLMWGLHIIPTLFSKDKLQKMKDEETKKQDVNSFLVKMRRISRVTIYNSPEVKRRLGYLVDELMDNNALSEKGSGRS